MNVTLNQVSEERPLWPHQAAGIEAGFAAEAAGKRCICITSPTGGGKRTMIVQAAAQTEGRSIIFTNRRLITAQTTAEFADLGMDMGVVAAGYPSGSWADVLVASVQTVQRRGGIEGLPPAKRVFIDEGHSKSFHGVAAAYRDQGTPVWMFTATPVGLQGVCDHLVVAGTNSELRACGALVPCRVFSPESPNVKGVKRTKTGEFYQPQLRKMFNQYRSDVFGNVVKWWRELNPWGLPTLLWAPGVPESRWFVEEFGRLGITAAHIDGETDEDERQRIFYGSKDGSIKVVCSYGVLREGGDFPWIVHGILVQVCGALSTYLQIVGRLLRKTDGKDESVLQDHSGAMWRHGSPNANREWVLGDTDTAIAKALLKARKAGTVGQPIRCPKCGGERLRGPVCPHCSHEHVKSVRLVRMSDGELKRVTGDMVKKRKVDDGERTWISCLYAAAALGRTVGQAAGDFRRRTGKWPNGFKHVPPHGSIDWKLRVADVYPWFRRKAQ